MRAKTARFWTILHNSPVKISLRPGQALHHHHGGPDEEGWSSSAVTWAHEGDKVTASWVSDGCDCDGRLTQYWEGSCRLDRLADGHQDEDGTRYPVWQEDHAEQRDFFAEAMGY